MLSGLRGKMNPDAHLFSCLPQQGTPDAVYVWMSSIYTKKVSLERLHWYMCPTKRKTAHEPYNLSFLAQVLTLPPRFVNQGVRVPSGPCRVSIHATGRIYDAWRRRAARRPSDLGASEKKSLPPPCAPSRNHSSNTFSRCQPPQITMG